MDYFIELETWTGFMHISCFGRVHAKTQYADTFWDFFENQEDLISGLSGSENSEAQVHY